VGTRMKRMRLKRLILIAVLLAASGMAIAVG
jgi:hypothetical protein